MTSEIYTYEDCEKEPLKTIGYIQDFAALGCFDLLSHQFVSVSTNFTDWLGISEQQLLNKIPISIQSRIDDFQYRIYANGAKDRVFTRLSDLKTPCDVALSRQKDILFIELQKYNSDALERFKFERILNDFMTFERQCHFDDHTSWLEGVANVFYKVIAFPRILVYRFESDWSGTVVAEKRSPDVVESYMGLRFPATDIPQIARDMFLLNSVRFIHNASAPQIPLRQIGGDVEALELTDVDCRGVSPFHIRYLQNMKVATSLSFALFHRERLWGLVSCHAHKPTYVDATLRSMGKELARHVSNSLSIQSASRIMRMTDSIKSELKDKVIEQGAHMQASLEGLTDFIKAKAASCGYAVLLGDQLMTFGRTPKPSFFKSDAWRENALQGYAQTEFAKSSYPGEEEALNDCAGIAHAWYVFPGTSKKLTLALFREALPHIVNWAGKPPSSKTEALSPARSFELWQERLSDHAEPWTFNDQLFIRQLVTVLGERFAN